MLCFQVDDPNKFWIHSEVEAELESVQNRLNTPGNIFSLTEKPVVGGIYAAPYPLSSEYLYRAQITVIYKESQSASVCIQQILIAYSVIQ